MKRVVFIFLIIFCLQFTIFSYGNNENRNTRYFGKNKYIQHSIKTNFKTTDISNQNINSTGFDIKNFIKKLGRIAGFLAFILFCIVFFIGGSNRLWDKYLGLNNVLRYHKYFAVISLGILLIHPVTFFIAKLYSIREFKNPGLLLGLISAVIFIIVVVSSLIYKYLNHSLWIWLHRFSAAAIILGGMHIFKYGFWIHKYSILKVIVYLSILIAFAGLVLKIYLLMNKKRFITEIIEIKKEIHNTYSIIVKKPKDFEFCAGQFCLISFKYKFMKKPHPITISSNPSDEFLKFTIKESGKFSKNIKNLKPGNIMKIDGPYGKFTFNYRDSVFIAGGVGITPFFSMLSYNKTFAANNNITLLYGCRNQDEIIFENPITSIAEKEKQLKTHIYLSQNETEKYNQGFINSEVIQSKAGFNSDFYICGPPKMIKIIKKILKSKKVSNKNIFLEKFFF